MRREPGQQEKTPGPETRKTQQKQSAQPVIIRRGFYSGATQPPLARTTRKETLHISTQNQLRCKHGRINAHRNQLVET